MTSFDPDDLSSDAQGLGVASLDGQTFESQTPVALVAIASIAAILFVNLWSGHVPRHGEIRAPAQAAVVRAECSLCGEIVDVRDATLGENGAIKSYAVDVHLDDGTKLTLRQAAPGFGIGARVQLRGTDLRLRD